MLKAGQNKLLGRKKRWEMKLCGTILWSFRKGVVSEEEAKTAGGIDAGSAGISGPKR